MTRLARIILSLGCLLLGHDWGRSNFTLRCRRCFREDKC